jgi:enoyl-CoA hydratase/carnithine racemase
MDEHGGQRDRPGRSPGAVACKRLDQTRTVRVTTAEFVPGSPAIPPTGDTGVSVVLDRALATVTLNRPEQLNAQTPLMWAALREIGSALPATVRVVLVQGAGRAFSAGLDRAMFSHPPPGVPSLADLAAMTPEHAGDVIAGYQDAFGWLARPDLVSIAAVQGHAVGAGFQLALACDLRVLGDDAVLTMAEVALGLVPDLGGTRRLVELVGYSRAMDLVLTARAVSADEAMAMGLASRVVARAELGSAALDLAETILAQPRDAVIEAKALLLRASATSPREQEAAERAAQHRLLRGLAGHPD